MKRAVPLVLLCSCVSTGRMEPKKPVPFDVAKSCDDKAMTFPASYPEAAWMPVKLAKSVAIARGSCAVAAIENADANREAAQYNATAADHNAPDNWGDRLKLFGQGVAIGIAVAALVALANPAVLLLLI